MYGTLTHAELTQRIQAWAGERGQRAEVRQTDSEGEYVQAIHAACGEADAVIVNPGAWTHYSWAIRDALAILPVPGRRGAPVGAARARAVAPPLGRRRRRLRALRGHGRRGLPRRARLAAGACGVNRVARRERLQAAMAERDLAGFIVNQPSNVRYLTGYTGSNGARLPRHGAALPDRLPLRHRGRPAGGRLGGRDRPAEPARRRRAARTAELFGAERIGFESAALSYAAWQALDEAARAAGAELVPCEGVVEELRAVKDADEIALHPRRRRALRRDLRLARRGGPRRPRGARGGLGDRAVRARARRRRPVVRADRRLGRERRAAARGPRAARDRALDARRARPRSARRRVLLATARARSRPARASRR